MLKGDWKKEKTGVGVRGLKRMTIEGFGSLRYQKTKEIKSFLGKGELKSKKENSKPINWRCQNIGLQWI